MKGVITLNLYLRPDVETDHMERRKKKMKKTLASDGTAGYGETRLPLREYRESDAPENIKWKWKYLWGDLHRRARERIQMDEVATFSVTRMNVARDMTDVLKRLPGISEKSSIVDCTACVGGNTVAFARYFDHVTAIELDERRCDMLRNNLRVVDDERRRTRRFFAKVNVLRGDCLKLCPKLSNQDILFFDPPWGGVDYKKSDKVPLFLGSLALDQVCLSLGIRSRYVALKLPLNADVDAILSDKARVSVVVNRKFKKMWLLVVKYSEDDMKKKKEEESLREPKKRRIENE